MTVSYRAAIFDDAFLREKERYYGPFMSDVCRVYSSKDALPEAVFSGTRTDCERFIHQRAREVAFAALREAIKETDEYGAVYRHFLASLAGDGDARKGE